MVCLKNTRNAKSERKNRWGIVGTGRMAHTFARALAMTENAEITAVCSRTLKKAQKFAKEVNETVAAFGDDKALGMRSAGSPAEKYCRDREVNYELLNH